MYCKAEDKKDDKDKNADDEDEAPSIYRVITADAPTFASAKVSWIDGDSGAPGEASTEEASDNGNTSKKRTLSERNGADEESALKKRRTEEMEQEAKENL